MRLLIVDDDETSCRGVRMRIEDMRFPELQEVDTAFSAEEALQYARKWQVDILLTDIRMANMDGLELISEVQQSNPRVCSLILTAYATFPYAQRAIELGVLGFLLKPFGRDEMREALAKAIEKARQEAVPAQTEPMPSAVDDPIGWAKGYVRTHLDQKINMSLVANELNLSYSYFSETFKQQTGQSFSSYVIAEKMRLAARMLREGARTNDIAEKLGYLSPQNFNRAFRQVFRCTPGEYRRRAGRDADNNETAY